MALRFAIAFTLWSLIVAMRSPLKPSFKFGNSRKLHGATSGDFGGGEIVGNFSPAKNYQTAKDE